MNIWKILGINPTNDVAKIKEAFARKSKEVHPEDNPEGFKELYSAYKIAVKRAKTQSIPISRIEKKALSFTEESSGKISIDRISVQIEDVRSIKEQQPVVNEYIGSKFDESLEYNEFDDVFQMLKINRINNKTRNQCFDEVLNNERFLESLNNSEFCKELYLMLNRDLFNDSQMKRMKAVTLENESAINSSSYYFKIKDILTKWKIDSLVKRLLCIPFVIPIAFIVNCIMTPINDYYFRKGIPDFAMVIVLLLYVLCNVLIKKTLSKFRLMNTELLRNRLMYGTVLNVSFLACAYIQIYFRTDGVVIFSSIAFVVVYLLSLVLSWYRKDGRIYEPIYSYKEKNIKESKSAYFFYLFINDFKGIFDLIKSDWKLEDALLTDTYVINQTIMNNVGKSRLLVKMLNMNWEDATSNTDSVFEKAVTTIREFSSKKYEKHPLRGGSEIISAFLIFSKVAFYLVVILNIGKNTLSSTTVLIMSCIVVAGALLEFVYWRKEYKEYRKYFKSDYNWWINKILKLSILLMPSNFSSMFIIIYIVKIIATLIMQLFNNRIAVLNYNKMKNIQYNTDGVDSLIVDSETGEMLVSLMKGEFSKIEKQAIIDKLINRRDFIEVVISSKRYCKLLIGFIEEKYFTKDDIIYLYNGFNKVKSDINAKEIIKTIEEKATFSLGKYRIRLQIALLLLFVVGSLLLSEHLANTENGEWLFMLFLLSVRCIFKIAAVAKDYQSLTLRINRNSLNKKGWE